jgi:hypothetical protein
LFGLIKGNSIRAAKRMSVLQRTFLVLFFVCLLSGCYEDTVELTLNADGSGTIRQKLVLSERFMVATSEDKGSQDAPIPDKEELVKKIGPAIKISSIEQTDLPDGGRVIELEGTFSKPEQFFLSDYCQEQIKLRMAPAGTGRAAIHCDMSKADSAGPSLTQLYGLAKGLHINRTFHLPAKIEKTNGFSGKAKNTVSWIIDLRNKEGLAQTKVFMEGPDEGKGIAIFDASGLKFSLPLKVAALPEKAVEKKRNQNESAGLTAEVAWISVQRAQRIDGTDITKQSYTEIGIELNWNEAFHPVRCEKPILLSLSDDRDSDLVTGEDPPVMQLRISKYEKRKELKLRAKAPSKNARKLKNLQGYVEVITDVVKESVVLESVQELVGKESTGNPVLDKLHFRIKGIQDRRLKVEVDGGDNTIVSLAMVKNDGSKVEKRGHMGWGNSYSYDFDEDIPTLTKCELEVVVAERTEKVPFSLKQISLP